MDIPNTISQAPRFYTLATVCLVITALYFGQDVLIPISLSVLLSFVLAPLVTWIERRGLRRSPSVLLVTVLTFAMLGGLGWVVGGQVTELAAKIPEYKGNLKSKIQAVKQSSSQTFSRLRRTAEELQKEIDSQASPAVNRNKQSPSVMPITPVNPPPPPTVPVQAEIVPPPASPLTVISNTVNPILGPLGTVGIVVVLSIFILLYREDLRDRLIRVVGNDQLNTTTEALNEAGHKVGKYLLMQLIVNVTYGIPVAIGLFYLGVPNAVLWGVLATVLRFIPYLGPWLAALIPIALSVAISDGWSQPMYVVGMFLALELVSNNVIEPLLYGKSTGVSPVAIIVAAIFWTWIWGTVGLLLSTPLTVCLVVIGKHVKHFEFLSVLLGDAPALELKVRIYQRLLSLDSDEPEKIVTELLEENSLKWVFDNVLVPALRLEEDDRHRGIIDQQKSENVREGMRSLIEHAQRIWKERDPVLQPDSGETTVNGFTLNTGQEIICVPARDEADELAGIMLATILENEGVPVSVLPVSTLAGELLEELKEEPAPLVIISAVPPASTMPTRYLLKRILNKHPNVKPIVAFWGGYGTKDDVKQKILAEAPVAIGFTMDEVSEQVRQSVIATAGDNGKGNGKGVTPAPEKRTA